MKFKAVAGHGCNLDRCCFKLNLKVRITILHICFLYHMHMLVNKMRHFQTIVHQIPDPLSINTHHL